MKVSACLVTRGNVDMRPILDSLPKEWEKIVWINSSGVYIVPPDTVDPMVFAPRSSKPPMPDLSVYGRYAAIEHATGDLIYVQDDDVIVSDPQAIVAKWGRHATASDSSDHVVCNMPSEFRHDFYAEHALVGFGAAFHRDAPRRAFERFEENCGLTCFTENGTDLAGDEPFGPGEPFQQVYTRMRRLNRPLSLGFFQRTCDVVFTALTPRVLVDVPKENLPYASDDDRMWKQPDHVGERKRMLELTLEVRDG